MMKTVQKRALVVTEILLALPVLFLLWILAGEFVERYGLVVLPVGAAVYLFIAVLVDKLFSRQSERLEQALERRLPFAGDRSETLKKHGQG